MGEVEAQERVYRSCGEGLVTHVLEGHDAAVIAYGQTSSGKSWSTFGTKEAPGLVPRLCKVWDRPHSRARAPCMHARESVHMNPYT